MGDYRETAWLLDNCIQKYIRYEKKPQVFEGDITLTQPEIHTITLIGESEGINLTMLAAKRGITKGAASQMIYKLVDKKLVEKRVSPDSDSEINLFLTERGMRIAESHRKTHEAMWIRFNQMMESIPKETRDKVVDLLQDLNDTLDELLSK